MDGGGGGGGGGVVVPLSHIPLIILKSHIPKINMANIPKFRKHGNPISL